ncbi:DUF411 domain-containing protein [Halopseudomonas laoshanensis]|uniref:DUF411 domain-containing protein n=1 Tax=Halopseudomonas laoshanensis TaxID=2268758 RepID=A0A7V7KZ23_9GAMM|nr:DUF411 domain-containing protein [Halopseudomonas laoshanensis]KAA0696794.1 DUF411 domain-containing protein [Halopseudomonas laoshanensis]
MKSLFASIALAASLFVVTFSSVLQAADPVAIDVYRDPNCGCCKAWITHLENNGFNVTDHVENNMSALKSELGVPQELASCHTAVLDGRFIEGHVPAADILKMRQQPDIIGLAVPGMPAGSPGMEMGDRVDAYDVISLDENNDTSVFSSYP